VNQPSAAAHSRLQAFIHHETTAGFLLVIAAAAAVIAFNIPTVQPVYEWLLHLPVSVNIGNLGLDKSLLHWINDGLMAIFFFLVGLEIKREVLEGNLSSRDQIVLPALAAVGGMAVPALIYWLVNRNSPEILGGWAIPAATDIAFALGALSIAGSRAPSALKVFLLTLATLDDLGAIIIIALFYTADLSLISLALAAAVLVLLVLFNRLGVDRLGPYLVLGIVLWILVLKSGIHATLAGVALALLIPLRHRNGTAWVSEIEEACHPYVKFLILPLFAFANAGIPLDGFGLDRLAQGIPLGVSAGLVVGKPLGILLASALAVSTGLARLPDNCGWPHMVAVGSLAGIGFTMSLFIGSLAFQEDTLMAAVRVGVVAGSLVSMAAGLAILLLLPKQEPEPT
jgi:NhaA family Na+:H+ antiporter